MATMFEDLQEGLQQAIDYANGKGQPCTDKYWSGKNSGQDKATSKEIPSGRDLTKISVICPSCNKVNEFPITDDRDKENRLRVEKHCQYCQAKIVSLYL